MKLSVSIARKCLEYGNPYGKVINCSTRRFMIRFALLRIRKNGSLANMASILQIFCMNCARFLRRICIRLSLYVTQYTRIMFVNSGGSENSGAKREMFEFVRICVANTCMTWEGCTTFSYGQFTVYAGVSERDRVGVRVKVRVWLWVRLRECPKLQYGTRGSRKPTDTAL